METANPEEIAKFTAMADAWWDPEGDFKPLHVFNPLRIKAVRDAAAAHFARPVDDAPPFAGLTLLDVGCGGGLIAEPMARLGFEVTGIDAAEKNIGVARAHAAETGVANATYRVATPETLAAEGLSFDVVLALEVVEHVDQPDGFIQAAADLVTPGGFFATATLNRTLKSLALAKFGAEYVLRWLPRGTHDWRKFVKPSELAGWMREAGLDVTEMKGLEYNPLSDAWRLTDALDVNYMIFGKKPV